MADRPTATEPAAADGLSPDQLAAEQAQDLPDREAMSLLDVGGLTGALPVPVDTQPAVTPPDLSGPITYPTGVPTDADLTNVPDNIGDISDVTDVHSLIGDLGDLKGVPDGTEKPIDGLSSGLA